LKVSTNAGALVVPTAAVQRGPNGDYVWLITDKPPPGTEKNEANAKAGADQKARGGARGKQQDAADNKPAKFVAMQAVVTGGEAGDNGLVVTSGLKAGDQVVTAGQFRLKQGTKVTPMKPGEVPAPPTTAEIKAAAMSSGGRGRRR
jgi:multidrug efflux system membrane fusion protein